MAKNLTEYSTSQKPRQKLSYSEKVANDNAWGKACIDYAIKSVGLGSTSRRSPRDRKKRNYNLFNGKFDKADMAHEVTPLGLQGFSFPAELQYRDIVSPIFTLLFGEEIKRGTSFVVRAINEDAISDKETKKKNEILAKLQEYLTAENPENPEESMKQVQKYWTYEYQDMREKTATDLLNYLRQYLKLDQEFSKGWEDVLLAGEEIYEIDIISGAPVARRCNPLETHFVLANNSDKADDAPIIIKDTFMPVNQVIDEYWEVLEDDEIEDLEDDIDSGSQYGDLSIFPERQGIIYDDGRPPENTETYMDEKGNVRVTKAVWASMKKIGELTYMDENEEQQKTYVDENYKPDKSNPDEVVDWFWITEYWEGTRIKNNIYKNIRPRRLQFRTIDNISTAKSGFVGTVYNANNSESVSLMDRLVPWIYLYITTWYRTELLMAANQGKIGLIDLSMVPEGWDIEKWMYYATTMKFAFVNSFNEGRKGAATGKLSGSITDHTKALDLETGNAIQHHISILDYVERKIHDLSGVSQQRLGAISASEGVGNVQRSVTQSAIITEKWFQVHNWTKQRVLEQLIETAKIAYAEDNKKLQYITDDLGTVMFNFDGGDFANDQLGVFVSDSIKDQSVLEMVKNLAQAALQNDKTELSSVIDVITSNSTAEIKNKLKQAEQRAAERENAQFQATQETEKAKIAAIERQTDLEAYNAQADREVKIQVATISAMGMEKGEGNSADIQAASKQALEERKQSFAEMQAQAQNSQDEKAAELKHKDIETKATLKREEMASKERLKEKEIAAKKEIEKTKVKNKTKPKS
jgi:hypothetical protein